MNLLYIFRE